MNARSNQPTFSWFRGTRGPLTAVALTVAAMAFLAWRYIAFGPQDLVFQRLLPAGGAMLAVLAVFALAAGADALFNRLGRGRGTRS